jgi:hypothetical protein
MAARDLAKLGCALALGLAIAFPAGMIFAGRGEPDRLPQAESDAGNRQVFSPRVLEDPHFRAQQRRNVEALERHCRESGELCAEAEGARAWLEGAAD